MSSADLTIYMLLDDKQPRSVEADWKTRVAGLNAEIGRTEHQLLTTSRKVFTALNSTVNTARAILQAFGIALPPAWEALLGAINTTFWGLQAMAAAYTAGGVTAAFAIPLEVAAMGLAWFSVGVAAAGQRESAQKLNEGEQALRSLGLTVTGWGRVFRDWG